MFYFKKNQNHFLQKYKILEPLLKLPGPAFMMGTPANSGRINPLNPPNIFFDSIILLQNKHTQFVCTLQPIKLFE